MNWKGVILLAIVIHVAAFAAGKVPPQIINAMLVNQFTIIACGAWAFVVLRRMEAARLAEVLRFRSELAAHRLEIISALDHRLEDLKELHDTAAALKIRTAEIAAVLAQKTKQHLEDVATKHEQLVSDVVAIKTTLDTVQTAEQGAVAEAKLDQVKDVVVDTKHIITDQLNNKPGSA